MEKSSDKLDFSEKALFAPPPPSAQGNSRPKNDLPPSNDGIKSTAASTAPLNAENKSDRERSESSSEDYRCWVCLSSPSEDPAKKWIQPCRCSGSSRLVHQECLKKYIETRATRSSPSESDEDVKCPSCLFVYRLEKDAPSVIYILGKPIQQAWAQMIDFMSVSAFMYGAWSCIMGYGLGVLYSVLGETNWVHANRQHTGLGHHESRVIIFVLMTSLISWRPMEIFNIYLLLFTFSHVGLEGLVGLVALTLLAMDVPTLLMKYVAIRQYQLRKFIRERILRRPPTPRDIVLEAEMLYKKILKKSVHFPNANVIMDRSAALPSSFVVKVKVRANLLQNANRGGSPTATSPIVTSSNVVNSGSPIATPASANPYTERRIPDISIDEDAASSSEEVNSSNSSTGTNSRPWDREAFLYVEFKRANVGLAVLKSKYWPFRSRRPGTAQATSTTAPISESRSEAIGGRNAPTAETTLSQNLTVQPTSLNSTVSAGDLPLSSSSNPAASASSSSAASTSQERLSTSAPVLPIINTRAETISTNAASSSPSVQQQTRTQTSPLTPSPQRREAFVAIDVSRVRKHMEVLLTHTIALPFVIATLTWLLFTPGLPTSEFFRVAMTPMLNIGIQMYRYTAEVIGQLSSNSDVKWMYDSFLKPTIQVLMGMVQIILPGIRLAKAFNPGVGLTQKMPLSMMRSFELVDVMHGYDTASNIVMDVFDLSWPLQYAITCFLYGFIQPLLVEWFSKEDQRMKTEFNILEYDAAMDTERPNLSRARV